MKRTLQFTPASITKILVAIMAVLLVANLLIIQLHFGMGYDHLRGFIRAFYFDAEANFPSLFSSVLIVIGGILLWRLGALRDERVARRSFYWRFLSIVFIFLAIDEFASIHESLIQPVQNILASLAITSRYLYFAWILPYLGLVVIVALVLVRFFLRLPLATRVWFVISGAIYLSGAVVMEMIGGNHWAGNGWAVDGSSKIDVVYAWIITAEESLEMFGMILFIHAVTSYYFRICGHVEVLLRGSGIRIPENGSVGHKVRVVPIMKKTMVPVE